MGGEFRGGDPIAPHYRFEEALTRIEKGQALGEAAARAESSPHFTLLTRMFSVALEESGRWSPVDQEKFRKLTRAVGILGYDTFTPWEKAVFAEHADLYTGPVEIDADDAATITRILRPLSPFAEIQRQTLNFEPRERPTRITEGEDPVATEFAEVAARAEDRIDFLWSNIDMLPTRSKVRLLLSLSDEDYDAFVQRAESADMFAELDLIEDPDLLPDPRERIRALANLRYGVRRYLIDADLRRRYPADEDGKRNYPLAWDVYLDKDIRFADGDGLQRVIGTRLLTYEEAIDLARYEYTRKFYNDFFPEFTEGDGTAKPTLTADVLFHAFLKRRATLEATNKPGTNITFSDLVKVLKDLIGEQTNDDPMPTKTFTRTPQTVLRHTIDIIADENAFEIPEAI